VFSGLIATENYLDNDGPNLFNGVAAEHGLGDDLSKITIAHDKGPPVARQARKAVSLSKASKF